MASNLTPIISILAVALTVFGLSTYLIQAIKGQVKPHAITWLLWSMVPLIIAIIQISQNVGPAVAVPIVTGLISLLISGHAFIKGSKGFTRSDKVFSVLSVASLAAWFATQSSGLAVILLTLTDMVAFGPTVHKAWHDPHSEHWFMYGVCALKNTLALLIMQNYTFANVFYPFVWTLADLTFCAIILTRQRTHNTSNPTLPQRSI